MSETHVRGRIVFRSPPPTLEGATVHVQVEDTTLADAPSRIVGQQTISDVPESAATAGLDFCVPCPAPDPQARYTVRVHVDLDGDAQVSPGDYLSTESYPVLTGANDDQITIEVRRVL
jgi:uncharacterized lipoprotein YbaY